MINTNTCSKSLYVTCDGSLIKLKEALISVDRYFNSLFNVSAPLLTPVRDTMSDNYKSNVSMTSEYSEDSSVTLTDPAFDELNPLER